MFKKIAFLTDPIGFPVAVIPHLRLAVQIFPITKFQIEKFLVATNRYGDFWYGELVKLNPRVSIQGWRAENRECVFLTGVFPNEAQDFAQWLGQGFRIPLAEEWRAIYTHFSGMRVTKADVDIVAKRCRDKRAEQITSGLWEQLVKAIGERVTWAQFSLMRGGIVEWVVESKQKQHYIGLGWPRPEFCAWLGGAEDGWEPLNLGQRFKCVGFRLVCTVL